MPPTKKPKTEATLVKQPEFQELIEKSGIELTKAEAHVMAFGEQFKTLAELSRPLADLKKMEPSTDQAKQAREHRLKLVKVRTGAKEIKDERKRVILIEGNLIQGVYNMLENACSLTESEYEEIEKHQERIEKAAKEKLKSDRVALLAPFETDTEYLPLDIMPEDKFLELLAREKERFEAVQVARLKAEEERIRAEKEAEENRLKEEAAEKERLRQQAIENERLKKEVERVRIEHEKTASENKKRIEAEQKIADAKQAELDRVNTELKAKLKAEQDEKDRVLAQQKAEEQAKKDALKAPDQEKVRIFFEQFKALQFPELTSEPGKLMAARVTEALEVVKKLIIQDSQNLK